MSQDTKNIPFGKDISKEKFNEGVLKPLEEKKTKMQKLVESCKLDTTKPIEAPPVVIKMYGSAIGTLGNLSLIQGKAKSKKSGFVSILVSAMLKKEVLFDIFEANHFNRKIVYFDTEQSLYHFQKLQQRIFKLSGINPLSRQNQIDFYSLRKLKTQERLEFINYIFEEEKPVFVIIDGIRDLIQDFNDLNQVTDLVSKILQWTEIYNSHISCILHENKNNNNARGHLGSELVNKAETVLSVARFEQDKKISIVSPEFCRDIDPDIFAFKFSDDGTLEPANLEEGQQKNILIEDLGKEDYQRLFTEIFKDKPNGLSYGQLTDEIIKIFPSIFGRTVAIATCKKTIIPNAKIKYPIINQTELRGNYFLLPNILLSV